MNIKDVEKIEAMRDEAKKHHEKAVEPITACNPVREFQLGQIVAFNKVLDACKRGAK